jgi:hypothetical protein
MTKDEATRVAQRYLTEKEREIGFKLALLDNRTIERSFAWIFFYNSERYLETQDFRDSLAGNAPIVVLKSNGRIHVTGTAHPLEHYLKQLEAEAATDGGKP